MRELTDFAFRWRGGRFSIDFTATFARRSNFDRLREPADLKRWLREAEIYSHTRYQADNSALEAARELRESIYRIFFNVICKQKARSEDVKCVNSWATRPVAGSTTKELSPATFELVPPPAEVNAGLTIVARDAVDLLTGPHGDRIKECSANGCVLLFLDTSRGRNRRWCSMERCGARAKMNSYRSRRNKHGN